MATTHDGAFATTIILLSSLLFFLTVEINAEESREQQCLARVAQCSGGKIGRPVCGTDGITYTSRCQLLRAQCLGVTIKHRRRCRKKQQCIKNQEYARKFPSAPGEQSYLPTCRRDGTYAPLQCHKGTGYCWCVNAQGLPLRNVTVLRTRSRKLICDQHGKSATRRRSPNRNTRQKRICRLSDKAQFNSNLIDSFQAEWLRLHVNKNAQGADLDRVVLDWKFNDMDANQNGKLDKTEYRDLKKLVKKFVKPKRCSKSFAKDCDMDRDGQISQQEWAECLTRDGMNDGKSNHGGVDDGDDDADDSSLDEEDMDEDYGPGVGDLLVSHNMKHQPPHGLLQNGGPFVSSSHASDESSGEHRDEDATDCFSDRKAVLNEQRSDNMYIPECTPDGRYKKIQCYKSVGYCWCVHEDTGKNIPGTSVKDQMPKCDQIPASNRPMVGCPEPKKTVFLKDLMNFLHNRMVIGTNDTNIIGSESGKWQASMEEKAATWNFVILDKNKNKVLERKEWKSFRSLVSAIKPLKRCGKRLPNYCDVNHDRKISLSEWLECLNTKRNEVEISAGTIKATPLRQGKNPIITYLKED